MQPLSCSLFSAPFRPGTTRSFRGSFRRSSAKTYSASSKTTRNQIVKHRPDGSSREGGFRTFELDQAPPDLIDIAVRAARPIGEGFYGIDIKETERGFIVMEVNDNPNLEHGIEDQVGKDEIWTRVLKWFIERFEQ